MGYSDNKKAIRRVEEYLKQMVASKTQLEFQSADPRKLSYHIFEGIKTSQRFATESPYKEYAELGAKFKIKQLSNSVVCEPREISLLTKSQVLHSVNIPRISQPLSIIGAAIEHKAPIMTFPEAGALGILELTMVNNWANKNGYHMIVSEEGLVLSKDEESRSLAWHP